MTWAAVTVGIAGVSAAYGIYSGEKGRQQQQNAVEDEQQRARRLEAEKKRKAAADASSANVGGYAGTLGSGSQALGGGG